MRNAGFIAILGVFAAASVPAATILVDVEPHAGIAAESGAATLYEDVTVLSRELTALEPNGLKGVVPRAHATEPGTLVLLGTGLLGVATILRRRAS